MRHHEACAFHQISPFHWVVFHSRKVCFAALVVYIVGGYKSQLSFLQQLCLRFASTASAEQPRFLLSAGVSVV